MAPTPANPFPQLRQQIAAAAERLKRSPTAASVVDPQRAAGLWCAAYQAAAARERIELCRVLEKLLDVLDEIAEAAPCDPGVPINDVLDRAASLLSASQAEMAELLGISTRTLQR